MIALTVLAGVINDSMHMRQNEKEQRELFVSLGVSQKDHRRFVLVEALPTLTAAAVGFTIAFLLSQVLLEIAALTWGLGLSLI